MSHHCSGACAASTRSPSVWRTGAPRSALRAEGDSPRPGVERGSRPHLLFRSVRIAWKQSRQRDTPRGTLISSRPLSTPLQIQHSGGIRLLLSDLLRDDIVAEIDALVAYVDARSRDQPADLVLRLAAERADHRRLG